MDIQSIKTPIGNFLSVYGVLGLSRLTFIGHELSSHIQDAGLQKLVDIFFSNTELKTYPSYDLEGTEFQLKVWEALSQIPKGTLESYSTIAQKIGVPGGARAVGSACKLNPIPLFIPCHRVVKQDRSIGEYALGADNKRYLLKMEAL